MSVESAATVTDNLTWKYPRWLLNAAFSLGMCLILAAAVQAPRIVPFLPLVVLGAVGIYVLFRNPLLHLSVVLASFVFVAAFEEGIDLFEVLYAILYASYLLTWFFRHVYLYRRPLIQAKVDIIVILLLVVLTGFAFVGLAFGGKASAVVAEYQSWTMLAFYFPVRDAISRHPKGISALFLVLVWLGLFVVIRNVRWLWDVLQLATEVWHVTLKGRVVTNEMLMLVPAFGSLTLALLSTSRIKKLVLFGLSYVFLFGLIVTQGRGYWLAFAFGLLVLFLAVEGDIRKQIGSWLIVGIAASVASVFIFFGDYALLLAAGLFNRILSIGTAPSSDVSLIGRFIEFEAVLQDMLRNPILGYGPGVPIKYWDITIEGTRIRPWIHNGYQALWFKYGIVGFSLVMSLMFMSIRNGLAAARRLPRRSAARATALVATIGLVASLVATIPQNVWYNSDTILMISLMAGMASGTRDRTSGT